MTKENKISADDIDENDHVSSRSRIGEGPASNSNGLSTENLYSENSEKSKTNCNVASTNSSKDLPGDKDSFDEISGDCGVRTQDAVERLGDIGGHARTEDAASDDGERLEDIGAASDIIQDASSLIAQSIDGVSGASSSQIEDDSTTLEKHEEDDKSQDRNADFERNRKDDDGRKVETKKDNFVKLSTQEKDKTDSKDDNYSKMKIKDDKEMDGMNHHKDKLSMMEMVNDFKLSSTAHKTKATKRGRLEEIMSSIGAGKSRETSTISSLGSIPKQWTDDENSGSLIENNKKRRLQMSERKSQLDEILDMEDSEKTSVDSSSSVLVEDEERKRKKSPSSQLSSMLLVEEKNKVIVNDDRDVANRDGTHQPRRDLGEILKRYCKPYYQGGSFGAPRKWELNSSY